jgi:hypothetical protein
VEFDLASTQIWNAAPRTRKCSIQTGRDKD